MPIAAPPTPAKEASAAKKPTASELLGPDASAGKGPAAPSPGAAAAGGGGARSPPRLSRWSIQMSAARRATKVKAAAVVPVVAIMRWEHGKSKCLFLLFK